MSHLPKQSLVGSGHPEAMRPRFSYEDAPWFDQPDALEVLARRHREGIYDDDQRDLFEHWIQDGYFVVDSMIDPDLIDEMLADIDAIWDTDEAIEGLTVAGIGLDPEGQFESDHRLLAACPKEERARVRTQNRWRMHGFFNHSKAAAAIFHSEPLRVLCSTLFGSPARNHYSINFEYGSEQTIHQDMAVFSISRPNHLVGMWIACEDVSPDSGPLIIYPGSHRERMWEGFPDYPVNFLRTTPVETQAAYYEYLNEVACQYEKRSFLAKKGQVLFWHGMVIHGGEHAVDRSLTRRSFVLHSITDGSDYLGELDAEMNW